MEEFQGVTSQGNKERERYAQEFGIARDRLVTLDQLVPGVKVIEDLIDDEGRRIIQDAMSLPTAPNKGQIRRFFQERLASDKTEGLGSRFDVAVNTALRELRSLLGA